MTKYYTIIGRRRGHDHAKWEIEFGDYDKETVKYELKELRYANQWEHEKREYKLIQSSHEQTAIDAAIAKLRK